MWIVRTKDKDVVGFTLPMGVTDKEKAKPIREEYGNYSGWGSPYPDSSYEIILTGELHSKFPYLTYESEPLWVDFVGLSLRDDYMVGYEVAKKGE